MGKIVEKNNAFVYLLKNELGRYKVGVTKNIKQRIKTLTYAGGLKIELIHKTQFLENAYEIEKKIHSKLEKKRFIGEWFNCTKEEALFLFTSFSSECVVSPLVDMLKKDISDKQKCEELGISKQYLHNLKVRYLNEKPIVKKTKTTKKQTSILNSYFKRIAPNTYFNPTTNQTVIKKYLNGRWIEELK